MTMLSAAEEQDLRARLSAVEQQLAQLAGAATAFVKLGPDIWIRRDQIASAHWERRDYMNGSATWLVVVAIDGRNWRFEHKPWLLGGADCYAIGKEILGAR